MTAHWPFSFAPMPLTLAQADALHEALTHNDVLRSALEVICTEEADRYRRSLQAAMTEIPRKHEAAADAASKAQLMDGFLKRVEHILAQKS